MSGMSLRHGHGDHLHAHHHTAGAGTRALAVALVLNVAFTAVEGAVGFATGSLSLLADAGHNLSDVAALAVALVAARLAERPATTRGTFGFKRAEILAAFVNAATLVLVAALVAIEAIRRFGDAPDVSGGWVAAVAGAGVAVNGVAAVMLFRGSRESLNLRASFLHLAGDAVSSGLVIVAGIVLLTTGFRLADPIASLTLAALIVWSAIGVLRASTAILMEQAPGHLAAGEVARAILGVPGVASVHDLHVWTIGSGFDALSAHVLVGRDEDCHELRRAVEQVIHDRFGIDHTTLQVEHAADRLLQIRRPG